MPKLKTEMMRQLRIKRRAAGLRELGVWVTPAEKESILKYLKLLRAHHKQGPTE